MKINIATTFQSLSLDNDDLKWEKFIQSKILKILKIATTGVENNTKTIHFYNDPGHQ